MEESKNSSDTIIYLCGNPGGGKSLIGNSYIGRNVFESGYSFDGMGITKKIQIFRYKKTGKPIIMDTPGLANVKLEKQAAEQIIKGLRYPGRFKINFVIVLNEGRLQPMDIYTINTVCSSITSDFEYGIIINNFSEITKKIWESSPKMFNFLKSFLDKPPACIFYLLYEDDLEYKPLLQSTELIKFLDNQLSYNITANDIEIINEEEYIQQKESLERELSHLLRELG